MLVKHNTDWKLMSPQMKSTHAHTHIHTHTHTHTHTQHTLKQTTGTEHILTATSSRRSLISDPNQRMHTQTEMEHRLTATSSQQSPISDPNPRTHNWNRTDWQPQVADKARHLIQANTRTHIYTTETRPSNSPAFCGCHPHCDQISRSPGKA